MNFKLNLTRTKTLKRVNDISPINALKPFLTRESLNFMKYLPKEVKKNHCCFDRQKAMLLPFSPAQADKISNIAQQVPVLRLILCFVSQSTSGQEFTEVYVF